jgi:hypothetical protein
VKDLGNMGAIVNEELPCQVFIVGDMAVESSFVGVHELCG